MKGSKKDTKRDKKPKTDEPKKKKKEFYAFTT